MLAGTLEKNKQYTWTVVAKNAEGASSPSTESFRTPKDPDRPVNGGGTLHLEVIFGEWDVAGLTPNDVTISAQPDNGGVGFTRTAASATLNNRIYTYMEDIPNLALGKWQVTVTLPPLPHRTDDAKRTCSGNVPGWIRIPFTETSSCYHGS